MGARPHNSNPLSASTIGASLPISAIHPHHSFPLWQRIWNLDNNCLPRKDLSIQRRIDVDLICPVCGSENESLVLNVQ